MALNLTVASAREFAARFVGGELGRPNLGYGELREDRVVRLRLEGFTVPESAPWEWEVVFSFVTLGAFTEDRERRLYTVLVRDADSVVVSMRPYEFCRCHRQTMPCRRGGRQ